MLILSPFIQQELLYEGAKIKVPHKVGCKTLHNVVIYIVQSSNDLMKLIGGEIDCLLEKSDNEKLAEIKGLGNKSKEIYQDFMKKNEIYSNLYLSK